MPHRDKAVRDIEISRAIRVITMLIAAQHGLLGQNVGIDVDVSFLGDTILLLRIMEHEGRLRRNFTLVTLRPLIEVVPSRLNADNQELNICFPQKIES
jgi:circadian clock protein KaiC